VSVAVTALLLRVGDGQGLSMRSVALARAGGGGVGGDFARNEIPMSI